MKKLLRYTLLFTFSLAAVGVLLGNLNFNNSLTTLLVTGFILSIFELILKPIIKILLLPISILTLGLIRSVINTLGLYIAAFLNSGFSVTNIHISTTTFQGIIIPEININSFWAYLVTSIIIGIIFNIFTKLLIIKITPKV